MRLLSTAPGVFVVGHRVTVFGLSMMTFDISALLEQQPGYFTFVYMLQIQTMHSLGDCGRPVQQQTTTSWNSISYIDIFSFFFKCKYIPEYQFCWEKQKTIWILVYNVAYHKE